jgi:hypothetical protein
VCRPGLIIAYYLFIVYWFGQIFKLEFFSFSHGLSLQVKTTAQLDAALSFLATTGSENLDLNKFEEACGVGNK